jgi:aquaporin Z
LRDWTAAKSRASDVENHRLAVQQPEEKMTSPLFPSTQLAPSASLSDALKAHWREYLMEAAELGLLMFGICLFGTTLYSKASPVDYLELSSTQKAFIMGVAVAVTTFLIIRSPFGRRTGAHFNPAITLTYFYLGRVHRWDTLNYVASQFVGGLTGVFAAHLTLGRNLADMPVCYVITIPGAHGRLIAFVSEFILSGILFGIVLLATNRWPLARFSPFLVALVTVFYYAFCPSLSGFSVNPARSVSSATFAHVWQGIWVYFAAPCLGMLVAAVTYIRSAGSQHVYCAKVFHDLCTPCPFNCRFAELYREASRHGANQARPGASA